MALRETIELDVAAARRQIQSLETALDSLATTIDIDVSGNAKAEIETIDNRLDEVVRSAERLAVEMTAAARTAGLAEVNVEAMARALGISEQEANQLVTELLQAQAAGNRTEDAARDIARQLGLAGSEADEFVRSLQRADRVADDINVNARGLVGTFGSLRTAVGGLAGVLATIGVGRGIAAAVQGARSAVNEFARLNESINAVEVTFEEASDQIFAFGQISAQSAGLSRQTFQQAVVPIGAVLRNFGFDARDAADASIELVQRAADLASVFNTDVNDALLAINSALVGQVEPLRRYGAEISVARAEQFAFATGLAQTKEDLDANVLTQARLGLILADTNRVAGDFVNTSEDFANAGRIAKAEFEEFASTVGEALLPAFEGILNLIPDVIDALGFLIPAFGDAADAAKEFFDEIDPGQDAAKGSPFAGFLAGLSGGLATFGDVFAGFGDLVTQVGATLLLDFEAAGRAGERFGKRIDNVAIAIGRVAVADILTETGNRLQAFAEGLGFVGRETENVDTFTRAFADFGLALGLTEQELREVIPQIIAQAQNLGLSGLEVDFLTDALTRLNVGLIETEPRLLHIGQAARDAAAGVETLRPTFQDIADAAQILNLEDAIAGLDAFVEAFDRANANLADEIDVFGKLPEKLKITKDEFIRNLTVTAAEQAKFEADLLKLFQIAPALATTLRDQGVGARGLVADFLADTFKADQANDILSAEADAATALYVNALKDQLDVAGLDAAGVEALTKFMEGFASPDIIAAVVALMGQDIQRQLLALRFNLNSSQVQLVIDAGGSDQRFNNFIPQLPGSGAGSGGGTFVQFTQNIGVSNPVAKDPETSIQQGAQLAGAVGGLLTGFGT